MLICAPHCVQCGAQTENEEPADHLNISPFTRQVQAVGSGALCVDTMFVAGCVKTVKPDLELVQAFLPYISLLGTGLCCLEVQYCPRIQG
jgi:hypothetical protein